MLSASVSVRSAESVSAPATPSLANSWVVMTSTTDAPGSMGWSSGTAFSCLVNTYFCAMAASSSMGADADGCTAPCGRLRGNQLAFSVATQGPHAPAAPSIDYRFPATSAIFSPLTAR